MTGIGIITYNRLGILKECLEYIRRYTEQPHKLLVADDGSTDGTAAWCRENGVPVVTGLNRGIAWNKNRALWLLIRAGCDPIVLMEEDTHPVTTWLPVWEQAAARWGQINFCRPHEPSFGMYAGAGTADDPYRCVNTSAQCVATSRKALAPVGYLDTRFIGFGFEHVEWTYRMQVAGVIPARHPGEPASGMNLALNHGLFVVPCASYYNAEQVARNREIMNVIAFERPFRLPWRTPEQQAAFHQEVDGVQL